MIELTIFWILITLSSATIVVFIGEKYGYEITIGLFAGLIVTAQILANKTVQIYQFTVPAGVLVYSVSYLITDILVEFHGKEEGKKAVWSGFLASIILIISIRIAIIWPSAPFWKGQEAFRQTLGSTWRIILSSLIAYIISKNSDVYIFDKIRSYTGESKLYLRNILSTSISQFIDTLIFISIAFYGGLPILSLIIGQYIIKLLIAVLDTPFIYFIKYSIDHSLPEKIPKIVKKEN